MSELEGPQIRSLGGKVQDLKKFQIDALVHSDKFKELTSNQITYIPYNLLDYDKVIKKGMSFAQIDKLLNDDRLFGHIRTSIKESMKREKGIRPGPTTITDRFERGQGAVQVDNFKKMMINKKLGNSPKELWDYIVNKKMEELRSRGWGNVDPGILTRHAVGKLKGSDLSELRNRLGREQEEGLSNEQRKCYNGESASCNII
ncbi:hypothetical protein [Pasteuria penetrans]|uniref:hypothetical protein n=1 Tax=Pasteuria penetrans TaxID=86005 RepID=UPI0011ECDC0C|nr:hypothetical protein [Pasteuria penetrans]